MNCIVKVSHNLRSVSKCMSIHLGRRWQQCCVMSSNGYSSSDDENNKKKNNKPNERMMQLLKSFSETKSTKNVSTRQPLYPTYKKVVPIEEPLDLDPLKDAALKSAVQDVANISKSEAQKVEAELLAKLRSYSTLSREFLPEIKDKTRPHRNSKNPGSGFDGKRDIFRHEDRSGSAQVNKEFGRPRYRDFPRQMEMDIPRPMDRNIPRHMIRNMPRAPMDKAMPRPMDREMPRLMDREMPRLINREMPRHMNRDMPRPMTKDMKKPMDRDMPRPIDKDMPRTTGRDIPRHMDRDIPRHIDRDMQRPMDRDMPRPMDRGMPRPMDRDMPRPMNRDMPRPIDKDITRPTGRDMPRHMDRDMPRQMDRDIPRHMDRDMPRHKDRDIPRPMDSDMPRPMDKDIPRPTGRDMPRHMDRDMPRHMDRDMPRQMDRDMPRPMDRDMSRAIDRDMPRPMDRDMARHIDMGMQGHIGRDFPRHIDQNILHSQRSPLSMTDRKRPVLREARSPPVSLFDGRRLDIFTKGETEKGSETVKLSDAELQPKTLSHSDTLGTWWHTLEERHIQQTVTVPHLNAIEEMITWTEKGILWQFPIDNEFGLEEEKQCSFADHIFLTPHLDPWCPKQGPVRHFMELVCIGLSKNPYMSVKRKKSHIMWYKNYFEEKRDLLEATEAIKANELIVT